MQAQTPQYLNNCRQHVFDALTKDKWKEPKSGPIPQMLFASDSRRAMGYSTVNSVTMTQALTLLTGISQIHISSPLLPSSTAQHRPKPAMSDKKKPLTLAIEAQFLINEEWHFSSMRHNWLVVANDAPLYPFTTVCESFWIMSNQMAGILGGWTDRHTLHLWISVFNVC